MVTFNFFFDIVTVPSCRFLCINRKFEDIAIMFSVYCFSPILALCVVKGVIIIKVAV